MPIPFHFQLWMEVQEGDEKGLSKGRVSLRESLAALGRGAKEAFNLFDADGSGAIDAEEMALAMKGLGFGDQ
eukprot:gene2643-21838_t